MSEAPEIDEDDLAVCEACGNDTFAFEKREPAGVRLVCDKCRAPAFPDDGRTYELDRSTR